MIDFFHKSASMTKRISGIAKLKGAPTVHARHPRRITRIAEINDEEDTVKHLLLEVSSTAAERQHGLMGRKSLPSICGMLFEGLSGGGYFWMKNCLIPLDIIFMNKSGCITKVYSMPADDGKKHYDYDDDDVSAIEMQYGLCKSLGIVPGFNVIITDIAAKDKRSKEDDDDK